MSCCEPRATGPTPPPGGDVSMINVGGGIEVYRNGTGDNPFELRTIRSADGSVSVTQNALDINLAVPVPIVVDLANEGTGAQVYDTATSTASLKNLRTIRSADGSVVVTQNALDINLAVPSSSSKDYFESSNVIITTNNTPYVTVWTSAPITGFLVGETWMLWVNCLVCHPAGLSTVNTRIQWQIETAPAVFTTMEADLNTNQPQTIGAGQRSAPYGRFYNVLSVAQATPRVRLQMSMSAFVATGGQVEYPRIYARKRDS